MIIQNKDKKIEFTVEGYELPSEKSPVYGEYNPNRLMCNVKYSDSKREIEFNEPCLVTYELATLVEESTKVFNGFERVYFSNFDESDFNLGFIEMGMDFSFNVCIHYHPDAQSEPQKLEVTEIISHDRAEDLINEFRSMLEEFPIR